MQLDTHELAWAAGLFDGEGYFGASTQPGVKWRQTTINIHQIDRRVLDRFNAATGNLGKVNGPYDRRGKSTRPQYVYAIGTFERCQAIGAMLWKWLSPVKRAQFKDAMNKALSFYSDRKHKPRRRLTEAEQRRIHAASHGRHPRDVAKEFGVGINTVKRIVVRYGN